MYQHLNKDIVITILASISLIQIIWVASKKLKRWFAPRKLDVFKKNKQARDAFLIRHKQWKEQIKNEKKKNKV